MRHAAALLTTLALVAMSGRAHAADADTEHARALFEEAGELERRGDWGSARDRLTAALRLKDTPQLRYALGWALENDDKLLEAKAEYEGAVRSAAGVAGAEEAARLAGARLAAIDHKMARIEVRASGGKGELRVVVDGREVKRDQGTSMTVAVVVNPGAHVVRVERGPDDASEQMVYLGRSAVRTVDVGASEVGASEPGAVHAKARSLRARTATASEETPASGGRSRDTDVLPVALLAGGLTSAALGGGLLVSAASDASDRANTKEGLGLAATGIGVVASALGAALLLRPPDGAKPALGTRAALGPIEGGVFGSAALVF